MMNKLIGEEIVVAQLLHEGTMDFESFCETLAHGTAVSAANVAMVMTLIEMRLPMLMAFNSKVICTPGGLTFRPKVSGSITQSQLTAKLKARADAHPDVAYDVGRPLTVSDLTTSDLSATIAVEVPQKWSDRFKKGVSFKRVKNNSITEV